MMRRILPLALCGWLMGCQPQSEAPLPGYAEADYVQVAAPQAGRLLHLAVKEGDKVQRDQPLFELDRWPEAAARQAARALLARSQAQAADLDKGQRPQELAALAAQLASAKAEQALAEQDLTRQQRLARQGFLSQASLDLARTRRDTARARQHELEAQLATARLGGREDARQAAQAAVVADQARLAEADWRYQQQGPSSPVDARVEETLYQEGEWVPAGRPVITLLPADGIKARFFVPQAHLSRLAPGTTVWLACDACAAPIPARITFIASDAEFTPPVIYSQENRAKLVFLVEARPDPGHALRPGQPLDVFLTPPPLEGKHE